MKRKCWSLGLTLFVVLVTGSVSASLASADFHSEASHTSLSGSQLGEGQFVFNAGQVRCGEASFSGTQSFATEGNIRVTPSFAECTAFGFLNAGIDVNGCQFELSDWYPQAHLICGTPMTITAFNCWVTIGAQSSLTFVNYTNTGSGTSRDIDVSFNVTGLAYTQHSKSFPGCSGGTRYDGRYTNWFTLRGFNTEGRQVGIWRE